MSTTITAAGTASGIDFESIIEALVEAKQTSLEADTTTKYSETTIELSGVSELKSSLESFQETIQELLDEDTFDQKSINTTGNNSSTYEVEADDDVANATFTFVVTQLCSNETLTASIGQVVEKGEDGVTTDYVYDDDGNIVDSVSTDSDGNEVTVNYFKAGTITINLGTDDDGNAIEWTVEVEEGDTLELIRKRINANDYGLTCTLIKTDDGYTISFDSGTSGYDTENNITITTTTDWSSSLGVTGLDIFNTYTTSTTYADSDGNELSEEDYEAAAATTVYSFADGDTTVSSDDYEVETDDEGNVTLYDAEGNAAYTISADGTSVTKYTYDDAGNVTEELLEGAVTTQTLAEKLGYTTAETEVENDLWERTEGQDAIAYVNGMKVSSSTNEFEDVVSGVTITATAVAEALTEDDIAGKDVIQVGDYYYEKCTTTIATDTSATISKFQSFVDAYNTLIESLNALYERNTYTDGENNYDGGYLAGNSIVSSIKNYITNLISGWTATTTNGNLSIYNMGFSYNTDGTLELDADEFEDILLENYYSIIELFTAEADDDGEGAGLLTTLDEYLESYTEYAGILDQWSDQLEDELDDIEDEMREDEEYIEKYEERIRAKYTALDTLIANYNNQLSYLSAIIASIGS